MKKKLLLLLASLALFLMPLTAMASKGDQGPDWSKYNGNSGVFGYSTDKFVFSQAGGFYGGTNIPQTTYASQVKSAQQAGKRVHTYLWDGVGGNMTNAKAMMAYYLPRVRTPKGSIVALDYEDGASNSVTANTNVILAQMALIKAAGYTPMLYSGKAYLNAHVNTSAIVKAYGSCLWLAEYPDYLVRTNPNYNYFPSMDGVAVFQFTSMYKEGGLDGNVDLTGITDNGYTTNTDATEAGKQADNTPKHEISKGDKVKVNFSAGHWSTGESIPKWVKGQTYTVSAKRGNKLLLSGINSWISKSNVESLVNNVPKASAKLPNGVKRESGTFTTNTTLRVWNRPGTSYTGVNYYRGESVRYQGYIRNGNYIYVAYQSINGTWHYVAVRENGVALGTFK